jgi:hypothetical protein
MINHLIETRFYNSPKGHTYQVNFYPNHHFEIIDPVEGVHHESDLFWMNFYYPEVVNDLIDDPLNTTGRDIQEAKWYVLSDGHEENQRRQMTDEQYTEASRHAIEASDGNWQWYPEETPNV